MPNEEENTLSKREVSMIRFVVSKLSSWTKVFTVVFSILASAYYLGGKVRGYTNQVDLNAKAIAIKDTILLHNTQALIRVQEQLKAQTSVLKEFKKDIQSDISQLREELNIARFNTDRGRGN